MKSLIICLALTLTSSARASYFQSPVSEAQLKDIEISTEKKTSVALSGFYDGTRVMILVPAYFSCGSTCPLFAENLRGAIAGAKAGKDVNVIFLSFNSSDKVEDMKMFRRHHGLPDAWTLAVVKSEAEVKSLLSPFGYVFQKTKDGYDHPNSALIFSKNKKWSGMLVGLDNKSEDIDKAVAEANFIDKRGAGPQFVQYLAKPEYLIVLGFVGVIVPLLAVLFIFLRRKKMVIEETSI